MICKRCNEEKGKDFYAKDSSCKDCRKRLVRRYRELNSDKCKEYDRKRYQEDPRVRDRHRRYQSTDKGRDAVKRAKQKWVSNNSIKKYASTIVGNAVRDGKLDKPDKCESCSCVPNRLHGHHDDYAFPLVVRWLCSKCHAKWHKENGEGANAS